MRFFGIVVFSLISMCGLSAEENFFLIDINDGKDLLQIGPQIDRRVSPCSTFKIALSLIGFDSEILKNENSPTWNFQEGYDDYLESWKEPQTPQSWLKHSCVWYSKVMVSHLGSEIVQKYLDAFEYGNRNISGGLTNAWLSSSLKISPREQVSFIQRMLQKDLPVSNYSVDMTKSLLLLEVLPNGWKLFGKTGLGHIKQNLEIGWFIGWIERDGQCFVFAYNICKKKVEVDRRIPRVKELLAKVIDIDI